MSAQQKAVKASKSPPKAERPHDPDDMERPEEETPATDESSDDEAKARLKQTMIHFEIMCTDAKNRCNKFFVLPEIPFESLMHKEPPPASRVVIIVYLNAHGFNSPLNWNSMDPDVRAPPPRGPIDGIRYNASDRQPIPKSNGSWYYSERQ
jgi:hypothetical protein